MNHNLLLVAFCLGILYASEAANSYKKVCYYTNWTQHRVGTGRFIPSNIDAKLCTNIIFAFAVLQGNQLATVETNDELLYRQINALKASNPNLKNSLAVGGWNAGSAPFSAMASSQASRTAFIQSTIKFLRDHKFDGLDIDWEYPAARGGKPADKQNLALLLKEMRAAFEQEATQSGKDRLLISIAVPAGASKIDAGFDVPTIAQNVDFINLMAYDFHGNWDAKTGNNAPLYGNDQLNTDYAAKYWASQGAPKEKIIVGMPFYGQTFAATGGVGAPSSGPGLAGLFTKQKGVLAYYEICKMMETGGQDHWDAEHHVPYYTNNGLWAGYDNVKSIREKAEWVKQNGFGGAMVWSLDSDDFHQTCASSDRKYPLLSAINDVLDGNDQSSTAQTTPKQTVTTMVPTDEPSTSKKSVTTIEWTQSTTKQSTATTIEWTQPTTKMSTTKTTGVPQSSTQKTWWPQPTTKMSTTQTTGVPQSSTQKTWWPQPTTKLSTTKTTGVPQPSTQKTWWPQPTTKTTTSPKTTTKMPARTSLMTILATSTAAPVVITNPPVVITNPPVVVTNPPVVVTNPPAVMTTAATVKPTTKASQGGVFTCDNLYDGFHRDPNTCHVYYQCVGGTAIKFACNLGTAYNAELKTCDWPTHAHCTGNK